MMTVAGYTKILPLYGWRMRDLLVSHWRQRVVTNDWRPSRRHKAEICVGHVYGVYIIKQIFAHFSLLPALAPACDIFLLRMRAKASHREEFSSFRPFAEKNVLGDRDRMWYATNWFSQITFTSSSSRQSLHIVPLIAQSPCLYVAAYKSVTRDQARRWRRRSKVFFLTPPSSWETDGAPRIILRPTHSCTTATCSYFSRGIRKYTRDILLDL